MKRHLIKPRADYQKKIEELGFDFHGDYWREEAYYSFSASEIDSLEVATAEAYRMYCDTAAYLIEEKPELLERYLQLPPEVVERIRDSWQKD